MTATPIPRTLALTAYGDLDVTAPARAARRPAPDRHPRRRHRQRARPRLRAHPRGARRGPPGVRRLPAGRGVRGAAGARRHGRVRAPARRRAQGLPRGADARPDAPARRSRRRWRRSPPGGADVLVATTVIEVGIDVPNATVMLVEDSERYGLSQLHQLRGRIGRGQHESVCLLFGPKDSRRLQAMAQHSDGFRLAEIDLELRGEGEMLGVRQSGLQAFKFARLPEDLELLERARRHAREILDARPGAARARARADRGRDRPRLRRRRAGADPGLDQDVEERPLPQADAAAQLERRFDLVREARGSRSWPPARTRTAARR